MSLLGNLLGNPWGDPRVNRRPTRRRLQPALRQTRPRRHKDHGRMSRGLSAAGAAGAVDRRAMRRPHRRCPLPMQILRRSRRQSLQTQPPRPARLCPAHQVNPVARVAGGGARRARPTRLLPVQPAKRRAGLNRVPSRPPARRPVTPDGREPAVLSPSGRAGRDCRSATRAPAARARHAARMPDRAAPAGGSRIGGIAGGRIERGAIGAAGPPEETEREGVGRGRRENRSRSSMR